MQIEACPEPSPDLPLRVERRDRDAEWWEEHPPACPVEGCAERLEWHHADDEEAHFTCPYVEQLAVWIRDACARHGLPIEDRFAAEDPDDGGRLVSFPLHERHSQVTEEP
jgi:hypothetical protein